MNIIKNIWMKFIKTNIKNIRHKKLKKLKIIIILNKNI